MPTCILCKGPVQPFKRSRTFRRSGKSATVPIEGYSCPDCSIAGEGPPFKFHTFEQTKDYDTRMRARWFDRYGEPIPPRKP